MCGANGRTYKNECLARCAKTEVAMLGSCDRFPRKMTLAGNKRHSERQPAMCAAADARARARCCGEQRKKIGMDQYGGVSEGKDVCDDLKMVTFPEAEEHCESFGFRLCSSEELERNRAAGTGCTFDKTRVWSSTDCDGPPGVQPPSSTTEKPPSTTEEPPSTTEKPPSTTTEEPSTSSTTKVPLCHCTKEYKPVCGVTHDYKSDGTKYRVYTTYGNECMAKCAGSFLLFDGPCWSSTTEAPTTSSISFFLVSIFFSI